MSETTTNQNHVFEHRWPWKKQEIFTIAFVIVLCVGIGVTLRSADAIVLGAVLAAIATALLIYTKLSRTATSKVTVTVMGSVVRTESKGQLGKSQVNIEKVNTFSARRYGSDETFMLSDGKNTLRLPFRAMADPILRNFVIEVWDKAEKKSVEGQELLEKVKATYNIA